MSTSTPSGALVTPRVHSPWTGETLPLLDVVRDLLDQRRWNRVAIVGPVGSGKATALSLLGEELQQDSRLNGRWCIEQDSLAIAIPSEAPGRVLLFNLRSVPGDKTVLPLPLCGWGRDELIDYLLATHPERCGSVLRRLEHGFPDRCTPWLWVRVLEALAADEFLPGFDQAVDRLVAEAVPGRELRKLAGEFCLDLEFRGDEVAKVGRYQSLSQDRDRALLLLQHPVRLRLGAEHLVRYCRDAWTQQVWKRRLPEEWIARLGDAARYDEEALKWLSGIVESRYQTAVHESAISVLVQADPAWRPGRLSREAGLAGSRLSDVRWSGVVLKKVELDRAEFARADLSHAVLTWSSLKGANFDRACLRSARLKEVVADGASFRQADLTQVHAEFARLVRADFTGADLSGANLTRAQAGLANFSSAVLRAATLHRAVLSEARLADADLTDVDLTEAVLAGVDLRDCVLLRADLSRANLRAANLEGVDLPGAKLAGATLDGALLTSSRLRGASLRRADLTGARLGEIDWEGADLREADLRGAMFHMGSTREGLHWGPYPGDGSKTGFYTDDFNDRTFKPPEEIRKANLQRADLRGAVIVGVDFYLVDLRGAHYDLVQREQLLQTGAILEDWPGEE